MAYIVGYFILQHNKYGLGNQGCFIMGIPDSCEVDEQKCTKLVS